jgi:hypothetical protein
MRPSDILSNLREENLPLPLAMQSCSPDKGRGQEGTGLGLGMLLKMASKHCVPKFSNEEKVKILFKNVFQRTALHHFSADNREWSWHNRLYRENARNRIWVRLSVCTKPWLDVVRHVCQTREKEVIINVGSEDSSEDDDSLLWSSWNYSSTSVPVSFTQAKHIFFGEALDIAPEM